MMTSKEIRQSFFDFFNSKGHEIVPSSPVVLPADPTLLFANSGMNQFKDIFLGTRETAQKRVADTQKCIRVSGKHNDLEEVGVDTYHHTFFEMLGNWSFGDYYKREAIEWAWELLTDVWGLDKSRIWATVYRTDDEAVALWKEVTDIAHDHILYFDEKDNFWEMGETGPCGPCSEIHYDMSPEGNLPAEYVNAGRPDLIEIWNLVFMQHNRRSDGSLEDLSAKHVDTGMGFERITAVLQNKASNYDTDIFSPLIEKIAQMSGKEYNGDNAIAMRVIADHIRTLSVAVADGVLPSNDGRGYVLRRILRRAVRYGRSTLGFDQPFLCELFPVLEGQLAEFFPELSDNRDSILRALNSEEISFSKTLDRGIALFEAVVEDLEKAGKDIFPGEEAFKLYDTYGFPIDLTALMASEKGIAVDEGKFIELMDQQRARARGARDTGTLNAEMDLIADLVAAGISTKFLGHDRDELESHVLAVLESGALLLEETPFYAESGGQLGDHGVIECENGAFKVTDTRRPAEGIILHHGELISGTISKGDRITAVIDTERRADLRRNHTATHLLNEALRQCVDLSIKQAGSMVAPDRLRFDFNYFEAVPAEKLKQVEELVNQWVIDNYEVLINEMTMKDVQARDDVQAVFDEKYGDIVRVVEVGDVSKELCGGTHVERTGDIGFFRILGESSVAAGVRRIEAVTGLDAYKWTAEEHELVQNLCRRFTAKPEQLEERLTSLIEANKQLEKEIKEIRMKVATSGVDDLLGQVQDISGVSVIAADLGEMPMDALRKVMDMLRQKSGDTLIVLGSAADGKACFAASASKELVGRGVHCGKLIGQIAKIADGGGGGKPDKAQAGGKDASKVGEAIGNVAGFVAEMV